MAYYGRNESKLGLETEALIHVSTRYIATGARGTVESTDEEGHVAAVQDYQAGPDKEFEEVYELQSGTLDLSTLALGLDTHLIREIAVATSQGNVPVLTFRGVATATIADADIGTFSLPAITLTGRKIAQALGFTLAAGARLSSCTLTATGTITPSYAGETISRLHLAVGKGTVTGEATEETGVVSVTAAAGFTVEQAPQVDNAARAWGRASFALRFVLTKDA